jgi:hypothetical protein
MQKWVEKYANGYLLRAQTLLNCWARTGQISAHEIAHYVAFFREGHQVFHYIAGMDAGLAEATREGRLSFSPGVESQIVLHGLVSRFILPSERPPRVMCWNEGSFGDFSGAIVSEEMRRRGYAVAKQHGLTYFDVNPGAVPLGRGVHLRCLFVDADQVDVDGRFLHVALLTLPGEARCRRVQWYEGGSGVLSDDLTSNDQSNMENLGISAENMPTVPLAQVLARAGVTLEDVFKKTESFTFLALTYLSFWAEEGGAAGSAMLHVPVEDQRRRRRKARQTASTVCC